MSASIWNPNSGTIDASLRKLVFLTDFFRTTGEYAAPGDVDNTAAMDAAEAYLATLGGGVIYIPYPGEWRMNWVCATNNITISGPGGKGEFDLNCIRPYNTATPAITFGDGVTPIRYCGIYNLHISGTDKTVGALTTATGNAPSALKIAGGVYDFHIDKCVLYNGIQTLSMIPTLEGESISGITVARTHIRNDLVAVSTARAIYLARYENSVTSPDQGYLTAINISDCRVNRGGTGGYILEAAVLGDRGITIAIADSYFDCKPDCGVKLGVGSQIICQNFQLDPGTTAASIIEVSETSLNISRYIVGGMRHGGQKLKNSVGTTIDLPSEADTFSYKAAMQSPYLFGPVTWAAPNDPYGVTSGVYEDMATVTGPLLTYGGAGRGVETANGARWVFGHLSEEITLSTVGTTTNSVTSLLPANAIIESVVWRVTQAITTAANFSIGDPTTGARFASASIGLTLGSTGVGLVHVDQTGAAGPRQTLANNLRVTCNVNPGAGKIRATVFYRSLRAPQS